MARPTSKITTDNFYSVQDYFQNLIREKHLFVEFSQQSKAEKAFDALPQVKYSKDNEIKKASEKVAVDALQAWVDQYAAHKWPNFLALQRLKVFKKKNRIRTVDLHESAYLKLKWYAEEVNLSLSSAIEKLAKAALDKIEQTKLEQKLAKIKNVNR